MTAPSKSSPSSDAEQSPPRKRPGEPKSPRGLVAVARGSSFDQKKVYATVRPRPLPFHFIISHYVSKGYEGFRCEAPGGSKKSWGIERNEACRVWPAPSRSVPMRSGYVYVFRNVKARRSAKGKLIAAFKVEDKKYTSLRIEDGRVVYESQVGEPLPYARIERYALLNAAEPQSALSIIDSPIRLSDERLFGSNGLIHDPADRGIPFSMQLRSLGDLTPMGVPPSPDEIGETFGLEVLDGQGSSPCEPLAEDWKRHRRHRFTEGLSLVELFSPDPFAEARRRNANFSHARKKLTDYLFNSRRSQLAFLAEAVGKMLARNPDYRKHVDEPRLKAWRDEDRKTRERLEKAVEDVCKLCVDWIEGYEFQQRLIDFAQADDDEVQHQSLVAYVQAIADFNACKTGNEFLKREYQNPGSFFNAAIGFGESRKASQAPPYFPVIRTSSTLIFRVVELYSKLILEDDGPGYDRSKIRTREHLTSQLNRARNLPRSPSSAKSAALDPLGNVGDAKAARDAKSGTGAALQRAVSHRGPSRKEAIVLARDAGHRGASMLSGLLERRTGMLLEEILFQSQQSRMVALGLITPDQKDLLTKSKLVAHVGLDEATDVLEKFALDPKVDRVKSAASSQVSGGGQGPAKVGGGKGKYAGDPEHWVKLVEEGRVIWLNSAFVGLDVVNVAFAFLDYRRRRGKGTATFEDLARFLGSATDFSSSMMNLFAGMSAVSKLGPVMKAVPTQLALREAGKKAVMEAMEKGEEFVARNVIQDAEQKLFETVARNKLQRVSGIVGAVSGVVELVTSSAHAVEEARQGDTDAMWGWIVSAAGGGMGAASGAILLFSLGVAPVTLSLLAVGSLICGVAGALMVAFWDDNDAELWLQKCHFGSSGGGDASLLEQINGYYQVICRVRVTHARIDKDGVHLELQPGVLVPGMQVIVHVQKTWPSVFVDDIKDVSRQPYVHVNAGRRVYEMEEFELTEEGGFEPKKYLFRSPQGLFEASGKITVLWSQDPSFRVESSFKVENKGK